MPLTFTHPLAVLPLRRLCPKWLNFPALVIRSMTPDFVYYLHQFEAARFAHSIAGSFMLCLSDGLLALGAFYLLRPSLAFGLPQPHRGALLPIAASCPGFDLRFLSGAAVSVLLGAWTHLAWDSLTHADGWVVQQFAILRESILQVGATHLRLYYILQHLSSFVGGALLTFGYVRWLRDQRRLEPAPHDVISDHQRYLLLGVLTFVAFAIAVPLAIRTASHYDGFTASRVSVFRTGVYAIACFVPAYVLYALLLYAARLKTRARGRR